MLIELRICHFALVEEISLPFDAGLTVLTGETGAGKSLIAGALSLLCGGKANKDLVRKGEQVAFVEGVFDLSEKDAQRQLIAKLGIHIGSDGILVLRRELRREGRSRVLINGLLSSLALLERIGTQLLCVQSQDQQRELGDPAFVRHLLDGNEKAATLLASLKEQLAEYEQIRAVLQERRQEEEIAAEQLDIWSYQHDELQRAHLRLGEEEELAEELQLKRHAESLREGAATALLHLAGEEASTRNCLGSALTALRPIADKSQKLTDVQRMLTTASEGVSEAATALERFLDSLDLDPAGLEELEERKALYEELRRKYRRDTPALLALQATLAERIARHRSATSDLTDCENRLEQMRRSLEKSARALHRLRVKKASEVARAALAAIRPLALPDLELEFKVEGRRDADGIVSIDGNPCAVTGDGADLVELHIRTNPGERMGPVAGVASGGERSRIHLGLTAMRQRPVCPPLLLFDEIDAGLGMDAARPIAVLLRTLARAGQVVCITHLPTIAVHCDSHMKVEKTTSSGRTVLSVRKLGRDETVSEVARLLGGEGWGDGDRDAQTSYALELLRKGRQERLVNKL